MGDVPGFGESRARVLQMCLNPLEQNNDIITSGVTEQTAHKVTWENMEGVWVGKKKKGGPPGPWKNFPSKTVCKDRL